MIINLQLFASSDGKTEKATPKKKQDTRKKGQVFQSREITSAMLLLIVFSTLKIYGSSMYNVLMNFTSKIFVVYSNEEFLFTPNGLINLFADLLLVCIKMLAPILLVALASSVVAGYAQVGFLFTTSTLGVKFSRINPISGLKRVISFRSLTELIKSILKITIVGYIGFNYINDETVNILSLMDMDIMSIAIYLCSTAINLAIRICLVLVVLGLFDYVYQWWQYEKDLKMTKQEIKEEYKQTEGNPEIKSKIKQKQRQISMQRMLQDVPNADVIITNPTHYAIAIIYDVNISDAPLVLAKGQDYLALRIKDKAKECKIEIVENKPLARTLYEMVDVGEAIPQELYQAVAEVLAFVYSLKNN